MVVVYGCGVSPANLTSFSKQLIAGVFMVVLGLW